jgi:hypothetical protein
MLSTVRSFYEELRARSRAWLREKDHVVERQRVIAASDKGLERRQESLAELPEEDDLAERKRRMATSDQALARRPEGPQQSTAARRADEPGA